MLSTSPNALVVDGSGEGGGGGGGGGDSSEVLQTLMICFKSAFPCDTCSIALNKHKYQNIKTHAYVLILSVP